MIRFRNETDERRYVTLRTEMFATMASAGVPADRIAMIMRNLGKVETMLHLEGMRQGLAMAAISEAAADGGMPTEPCLIPDPYSFKAFQRHAIIYGSSDTPLRETEKEWLTRLGFETEHLSGSWLDDKPLRFAPTTLEEWMGQQKQPAPVYKIDSPYKPRPVMAADTPAVIEATGDGDAEDLRAAMERILGADPDEPDSDNPDATRPESPAFLDLVRDNIKRMQGGGWKPEGWADLIMRLHREMQVDAAFLDLQLTTHMGRTVLDQCGLQGMAPGAAIMMSEIDGSEP